MKLYHYTPKENSCLEKGILSVSLIPECLSHYASRAKSEEPEVIIKWLDSTFYGRSRSIACFTEPLMLNGKLVAVDDGCLFSFDIDALIKDNLVESIYQKTKSGNGRYIEEFKKIEVNEIDYSPLDFSPYKTEEEITNVFFRHYFVVLKDGYIPPQYLTKEK